MRGFFYRVVDISEDLTANTLTVEVQTPLRSAVSGIASNNFTVVVLENVSEVFDRGVGFLP